MKYYHCFNRTNVELKWQHVLLALNRINRFNRTNVELKCGINIARFATNYSFNRTNVELKYGHRGRFDIFSEVLIVLM